VQVDRIEVSRRIEASASALFAILSDPRRHAAIDGSEMLRGTDAASLCAVGDVFAMRMHLDDIGDYVMLNLVVEYEADRRIGWEPAPGDDIASEDGKYPIGVPAGHRWSFELVPDGPSATTVTEIFDYSSASEEVREAAEDRTFWIEGMTRTLAALDALCAGRT
jgi:hypothetical protein